MPDFIPLASDTETKPTGAMREAIAAAEVGDEQRGEDPSVNRLCERVAELLGKDAALFLPSGTMCNIVSIKTHTQPGDAVLSDWMAHIIRAESGGAGVCSGVMIEAIATERGIFTPDQLDEALDRVKAAPFPYSPIPRLVCVEQTHNFGGGAVWTMDELRAIHDRAREHEMVIHMDGARLMNAAIASGTAASGFAANVDSVWIDFTKGLGAPMGAVLAGSTEFIRSARRYKHVFGGAMRQAGIAAAGCLYALDHHVNRIADDHQNARRLAAGLAAHEGISLRVPVPESNILFFDVDGLGMSNKEFCGKCADKGVRFSAVGTSVRAVTHLDVSRDDIETALEIVKSIADDR